MQVLVAAVARDSACQVWDVPMLPPEEESLGRSLVGVPPVALRPGMREDAQKPVILSPQGQLLPPGTVGELWLFPCRTGLPRMLLEDWPAQCQRMSASTARSR